jgi:hypothetical protein
MKRKTVKAGAHIASIVVIAALLSASAARGHDDDHYYEYSDAPHGGAYDDLHGYGYWRYVPSVGARLWFPYVEASWRPYYHGHWIHTSAGMTWVSYEPWGAIPHHYGQWVHVDHLGWGWVPGWEYSPAWVTWGVVDGYVGWVPCAPAGYRYPRYPHYRAGIWARPYGWAGSFGYHTSGFDLSLWVFVPNDHFYATPVHRHALPPRDSLSLVKWKDVRPNQHLSVDYVQKISKQKIRTVETVRKTKRIGDRSIPLYEPRGQQDKVRSGRELAKRSYKKVRKATGLEAERRAKPPRLIAAADPVSVNKKREAPATTKRTEKKERSSSKAEAREKNRRTKSTAPSAEVGERSEKSRRESTESEAPKRRTKSKESQKRKNAQTSKSRTRR